jgi:hypothetical protein
VARPLKVYFQTDLKRSYSEERSAWVTLPAGGGYVEVVVDLSTAKDSTKKPTYVGKIVALRVDPIDSNGAFGIDYIYVGTANRQYIKQWDFNGQSNFTNPFFGWRIGNIANGGTNGAQWWGSGMKNDPQLGTDVNFDSGIAAPTSARR